ncbi:ogr/Delta-like zinc finger family protein [Algoriphagus yeomjeoni]|uniref:ogr/Delta-like zinc finger family protein n=1 Tax=Algoriphagus yeomjeoni TaxID=291403 RepID=UPI000DBAD271
MNPTTYTHQFLSSDQPTTCPHCGLRTEIISDQSHTNSQIQIHQCPDTSCGFQFVVTNDVE